MSTPYSPYAAASAAGYYYDKKEYVSPSPTPSPRGPTYFYGSQPQRPATRAHFRHMSSSGATAYTPNRSAGSGTYREYASTTSRPPTFSPRYTSDGHYATANVSSSRSAQRQPAMASNWTSHRPPRRERRSASYSYRQIPDPIEDSDEELIKIDGVTYVLSRSSRREKMQHKWQSGPEAPHKREFHYCCSADKPYRDSLRDTSQYNPALYGTNRIYDFEQGGYAYVEKDFGRGFESPRVSNATPAASGYGHSRRASTSMPIPARPATARPSSSHYQPPVASSTRKPAAAAPVSTHQAPRATEADAKRFRIPSGYSLKNWDPREEPILLLGSVFDANSLGKWIYDWTTYHHGPNSPISEVAGELWLLLIQLAGKIRRTDEVMPRVRAKENREMLEDFILSGERLTDKLRKLLKTCEAPMLRTTGKRDKAQLGKNAGIEFVETLFGHDREIEKTERFMQSVRLWNLRFDANCEEILLKPTQ
ncbi:hypothetical protein SEPCBS119000_001319 [Sporothrix epigloea]|uniref:Vegetative cell wall protein gp1 n=1 Tax=Sporothrix epigloea TaxID=1892477 RepID=A0ABP0DBJ4_9PEZI